MQDNRVRDALGYTLARAFRMANRATAKRLKQYDVSAEQAHILFVLWSGPSMRVGELQRVLALSSATIAGALDRMEQVGLVRRVDDEKDGRASRVEPAPMVARRRRGIEEELIAVEREAFAALTAKERTELLRLLKKVAPDD